MSEFVARIFWLAVLSAALAYVFFLLFGSLFIVEKDEPIIIRDALARGKHTVSGIVMVPTPCTELNVQATKLSATVYTLQLETWDDPSVDCEKAVTARSFNTVAFAPTFGVQFLVYLDGKTVPFEIIPVMPESHAL